MLLTIYPYVHDIHFVFEVYVFMIVISNLAQLLELRLTRYVADQKLETAYRFVKVI